MYGRRKPTRPDQRTGEGAGARAAFSVVRSLEVVSTKPRSAFAQRFVSSTQDLVVSGSHSESYDRPHPMAIDCPGCLPPPSQADTTFELAPKIDWPDLYHLHQAQVSYDSFCETIDQYDSHLTVSIEAIRKTVLHLRALRNARAVVHRLPPEILIHILSELVLTSDPPSSSNLVAATHVCRRWRTIALDCPVLWTSIVGANLHKTETFVHRSRDMLLDIHLHLVSFFKRRPPEVPHFRNLELGVLQDRLRSLTVVTVKSNLDQWSDMFLSGTYLSLEHISHLCLGGNTRGQTGSSSHSSTSTQRYLRVAL